MVAKRKRVPEKKEKAQKKLKKKSSDEVILSSVRSSDDPELFTKKGKWTNKQRVLVFSSRGISYRARHLMTDLRMLMPHSKAETKMDRKDQLTVINEISEMKNCNHCIYFEARKKKDLYMWISNVPNGPSAKFLVENVHTMEELKMTGNCLKTSRPLLSFDQAFDKDPHWSLLKEVFTQVFGTPYNHPRSQPFVDHVFTFSIADNRIWFRNYQIVEEDGSLAEIGPRFVLNPVRIFDGSFSGQVLYHNPHYMSPNEHRRLLTKEVAGKYISRVLAKKSRESRHSDTTYRMDPTDEVFTTITEKDTN